MEKKTELKHYFNSNEKRKIRKWNHYFDVYERHFNRFRGKEIVILEIGVDQGGSLQMWKYYFGDKAKIFGIDIDPRCKELEEENISIFIGSQSDKKFLKRIKNEIPPIDILIDDGGHYMNQQIKTFKILFDHIKEGGVYLCEDVHTSYWSPYGGGYNRTGTFIEFSKKLIDYLNAYHSKQKKLKVNEYTKTIDSIHFYDSIVVVEKGRHNKPFRVESGNISFERKWNVTKIKKAKLLLIKILNKIFAFFRLPGIYD